MADAPASHLGTPESVGKDPEARDDEPTILHGERMGTCVIDGGGDGKHRDANIKRAQCDEREEDTETRSCDLTAIIPVYAEWLGSWAEGRPGWAALIRRLRHGGTASVG